MLRHAKEQNDLLFDIEDACDPEEWKRAKLMAGHVLHEIWQESLTPIFREHPDLIPPGVDFDG